MIPAALEKLILNGEAEFDTLQIGYTNLNVIPVPNDSFIVILGLNVQPPKLVRYAGNNGEAVPVRIEIKSLNRYNSFLFKSNNGQNFENIENLYLLHKSDIGILLTAPKRDTLQWNAFASQIDSNLNKEVENIVNLNTNPINTIPQFNLGATRGSSAGTINAPADARDGNNLKYTNAFTGGVIPTEARNFNFTSEPGNYYFGSFTNYDNQSVAELNNGFYALVKFVRVNKSAVNKLL
jgi:hypothetical protein